MADMYNQEESFFQCPFCFEQISFILETDYGRQQYTEDCEVCCRPIEITYEINEGELKILHIKRGNE